jgi:hypothetical protein
MRDVFRAVAAVRLALSTRRDLLLEILALRHQLAVLARSNRRFRASDRLLWLLLRRSWLPWRHALVLVQPATVDRWHRRGFCRCWRRRSQRPGRPRIDSTCRDLIRRLAAENHLWGAPRIHGELLKLGIAVSERTVSRYLQGRPTARSQTWRTFFANHLRDPFMQPVSSSAPGDDDVVDAAGLSCRPIRLSLDGFSAASPLAMVAWPGSRRHTFLDRRLVQDDVHDRTNTRNRTSRDPPLVCRAQSGPHGVQPAVLRPWRHRFSATDSRVRPFARPSPDRARSAVLSLGLNAIEPSTPPEGGTTSFERRSIHLRD